jgi:HSP20 family protein
VERRSGSFSRTLTLPCAVNEDEVAAEYTQGVLSVKLPKCEEAKSKKVAVKG